MICDKCRHVNKDSATTCKHCGADIALDSAEKENENELQISAEKKKSEPKSAAKQIGVKIELDSTKKQDNGTTVQDSGRSWFIPAIVGAGIVIVAGIVVFFVLLLAGKDNDAAAAVQTATPAPTPTVTATPTPTPTPIPTTTPEPEEDMSSLFERPSDATIGE